MFKSSCLFILILFGQLFLAKAQAPLNDNCAFALPIIIPDDGDTCFNASTINCTSDGFYNSCDSPAVFPLPAGGNEVWYSFISTGILNTVVVSSSGGSPAQFLSVTHPSGNCNVNLVNTCNTALTSNGDASVSWSGAAGIQQWFSVTALSADGDFNLCITSVTPPPIPAIGVGDDCLSAIPICDKHTFISPGPVFNNATGPISCYAFGPQNVLWYKFTAGTSDSLIWLATPNMGYELDWSLNDITLGCPGIPVACNFATTAGGGAPTGMVSGSLNPCGAISQICLPIVLTAGNTYALHFNIENFLNVGVDTPAIKIEFGGNFKMAPHADFSLTSNAGCDSVTTAFINNSIAAVTYQWDFGNGNTSNLANPPSQTYLIPGTYIVSLIASNPLSCASVTSKSITVLPRPAVSFNVTDTLICAGLNDTISFSQPVSSGYTYNWNFNGATIVSGVAGSSGPYIINWPGSGIKTIQLTVTDTLTGCISNLFTRNVTVISLPDSTFSMAGTACEGDAIVVNFTGAINPGTLFNWNFGTASVNSGSGSGPYSISYPVSGTFNVSLQVDFNGCIADDTNTVVVSASPISFAGTDQVVCSSESIQLGQPGSLSYSYSWSPAIGLSDSLAADPVFSFINNAALDDTLFYILTTSVGSCIDTDTLMVVVKKNITSDFVLTDDTLCGQETTTINYIGNAAANAIYNWNFSFGNAINQGGQQYSINWINPTTDSVSLFITQNGCSSDTTYVPFVTAAQPTANAGLDISFCSADTISIGSLPIAGVSYNWAPSTGLSNSTVSNPDLTLINNFPQNDTVLLILQAKIAFCIAYDTVAISIKPVQGADISGPVSVCINNNAVQFSNTNIEVSGSSFNWNFGNNANPVSSNLYTPPLVSFSATGTQFVYLTASTVGCSGTTDSLEVTVYPVPSPGFINSVASGCPPLIVSFTDTTQTQLGSSYFWNFGNGATSSLQNPVMIFQQPGVYNVSLTVTTPDTCDATFNALASVTVFDLPIPQFTATPPVTSILNPQIAFTSQSLNADSCFYYFGDGFTSTKCDDFHVYTDTGIYLVQLIAVSSNGCSDTTEQFVEINVFEAFYIPNAFTPNNDGRNDRLTFTGSPVQDFTIEIFNRWGQLVFLADNIDSGWDGRDIKSGLPALEGIYAYKISYTALNGKKNLIKGVISLLR